MKKVDRILFIMASPNKIARKKFAEESSSPPLGLLSMSAYLSLHGYKSKVIDLLVENYSKASFMKAIGDFAPHLVGIGTYTESFSSAVKIARMIKKQLPGVKIVFGGPHVTFLPEEALGIPEIDYVIRNEGEATLIELLEYLNHPGGNFLPDRIKGLSYRDSTGTIVNNEKRPYVTNLDILPWPDFTQIDKKSYKLSETTLSSRGCPGGCIYCASRAMSGTKYRMRSAENLFSEIFHIYHNENKKYFNIFDDTFTVNIKRLKKFCALVKQSGLDIKWRCDSRADVLKEEIIDILGDSGCVAIHIGIESGSQEILDKLKKKISLEKAERMVAYSHTRGITPMCSFMFGHHCDTPETIKKTFDLAVRFQLQYNAVIAFSTNTPFPGTPLYKDAEEFGLTIHSKNWDHYDILQPIISTRHLSMDELRKIIFDSQMMLKEKTKHHDAHREN